MFWMSRCRPMRGLKSTAMDDQVPSGKRVLRKRSGPLRSRRRPRPRARTAPALHISHRPPAPPLGCAPGASSPRTTGPATSPDWLRWVPPWRLGAPVPFFTLPAFITPNTHGSKTPCRTPIFLEFGPAPGGCAPTGPAVSRFAARARIGETSSFECSQPRPGA